VGSIWLEGGREGVVCGEAAELRGGVADDELWARNRGGGSGVLRPWRCGEARGPKQSLDRPTEGQGEERDDSPGRKTMAATFPRIVLGRGRRGMAEAGAGKEGLGAALL
jgi:hypothetical protein